MKDNWYKKWFDNKEYLELYSHRNSADAKKAADLIVESVPLSRNSSVLDLACGNGRHSLIIASRGYNVLGADLSPFLINEAKKKLKNQYRRYRKKLSFELMDMRKIPYKNKFDLVVNLFSSFGYFDSDEENIKVVSGVSKSLRKGGYFFFDFLNENYVRKRLVPFDFSKRNRKAIIQVREITGGFVKKSIIIVKNPAGKLDPEISYFHEKIRLFDLNDFRQIFIKCGLKIVKTFGNYKGDKFNKQNSERLIIVARKK